MDEEDIKLCASVLKQLSRSKEFELSAEERETLKKASYLCGECA